MISAVITAAGNSSRFKENKLLVDICGKPLIIRTVTPFVQCSKISEVIVTVRKEEIELYQDLFKKEGLNILVVEGGKERIQSIYNGVKASRGNIIITHDGARPLTPPWLIENLIAAVEEHGAAMTAVAPTATVKYAEDDLIIRRSLARTTTWIAQTPQGFQRDILLNSLESAISQNYFVPTDDSEIVAMHGHKVKIVVGDYSNLKVTVKSDQLIANEIFNLGLRP